MSENLEIEVLQDELYRLSLEEDRINEEIQDIRDKCEHVRVDYPGVINPWWCEKCGGEMPRESV